MGLFDKGKRRKGDEFDSPVEQIDLSTAPLASAPRVARPTDGGDIDEPVSSVSVVSAARPADDRRPARTTAESGDRERRPSARRPSGYGIDDAIALMRTLPSENVELVVQVVKFTLESTKIDIGTIIEDASDKQARIEARVKVLKTEITDLENEIATRRKEIEGHDADHRETTMVKDRLQLAERLSSRPGDGAAAPRPTRSTGEYGRPKSSTQPPPLGPSPAPAGTAATAPTPAPAPAPAVATPTAPTTAAAVPTTAPPTPPSGPIAGAPSSSGTNPPPIASAASTTPAGGLSRPPTGTVIVKK